MANLYMEEEAAAAATQLIAEMQNDEGPSLFEQPSPAEESGEVGGDIMLEEGIFSLLPQLLSPLSDDFSEETSGSRENEAVTTPLPERGSRGEDKYAIPYKCLFPGCGTTCKERRYLHRHYEERHVRFYMGYRCDKCGFEATRLNSMRGHLATAHQWRRQEQPRLCTQWLEHPKDHKIDWDLAYAPSGFRLRNGAQERLAGVGRLPGTHAVHRKDRRPLRSMVIKSQKSCVNTRKVCDENNETTMRRAARSSPYKTSLPARDHLIREVVRSEVTPVVAKLIEGRESGDGGVSPIKEHPATPVVEGTVGVDMALLLQVGKIPARGEVDATTAALRDACNAFRTQIRHDDALVTDAIREVKAALCRQEDARRAYDILKDDLIKREGTEKTKQKQDEVRAMAAVNLQLSAIAAERDALKQQLEKASAPASLSLGRCLGYLRAQKYQVALFDEEGLPLCPLPEGLEWRDGKLQKRDL